MRSRALLPLVWTLLAGAAASDEYTYSVVGEYDAVLGVPFALKIDGSAPSRVSLMVDGAPQSPCFGGTLVDAKDLDAEMSAGFVVDDAGEYAVCVNSVPGGTSLFYAGMLDLRGLSFSPVHLFRGYRTVVTFSQNTPSNATFTVNSQVRCGESDDVAGPFDISNWTAFMLFEGNSGGFICITWPPTNERLNAGKVIVSEQFTFAPQQALRYEDIVFEIDSFGYADGQTAALSADFDCATLVTEPMEMGGKWGVEVTTMVEVPPGVYFMCVNFKGHYTPCQGKLFVTAYSFHPMTLLAGVEEIVTLEGAMAADSTVTFHDTTDCLTDPDYGPVFSRDYRLNLIFDAPVQYTMCIKSPDTGRRVRSGTLTVTPPFAIEGEQEVVRGVLTEARLIGGSPPETLVKLVDGSSCSAPAVEQAVSTADKLVSFAYLIDTGDYTVCIETSDGTRQVPAGLRTVVNYTIGVKGATVAARATELDVHHAPADGMNLTFVRRMAGVEGDTCAEESDTQNVDVQTIEVHPEPVGGSITFRVGGNYDICAAMPPSTRLTGMTVSPAYTHYPYDAVIDTPLVLVFGGGAPRNTTVVLLPVGSGGADSGTQADAGTEETASETERPDPCAASAQAGVRAGYIDGEGFAYFNLSSTAYDEGVYTVCVDSQEGEYIPTATPVTLHRIRNESFTELIQEAAKSYSIDGGWPMAYIPSYTRPLPADPVPPQRTWSVRVVRHGTPCEAAHYYVHVPLDAVNNSAVVLQNATATASGRVILRVMTEEVEDPSLCVAVPVSDYLPEILAKNASIDDPRVDTTDLLEPVVWLHVGTVRVSSPVVVVPPSPPDSNETVTGSPNGVVDIIRHIPFYVALNGRENPADLAVVLTMEEDCGRAKNFTEPTRIVGHLNASLVATFVAPAVGRWFSCAFVAEQWFQLIEYDAVAMEVIVDAVFVGNSEPRTLETAMALEAGIETVFLMEDATCASLPEANALQVLQLSDAGTFDVALAADVGALRVCGFVPQWDIFVTIGALSLLPLPTSTALLPVGQGLVSRLVPWTLEVAGVVPSGRRPPFQVTPAPAFFPQGDPPTWWGIPSLWAKVQQGGCADGSAVPGGAVRRLDETRAAFMLNLARGSRFVVCVTYSVDYPDYFVPAGEYEMDGLFYPTSFQRVLEDTIYFRKGLPEGATLHVSTAQNCSVTPRRVSLEVAGSGATNMSVLLPFGGFLCLQESEDAGTLKEIGRIDVVNPFRITAPDVVLAGERLHVHIPPDDKRSELVKLAYDRLCDDDAPALPQTINAATRNVTFDVQGAGVTGRVFICVMTVDATNSIASAQVVVQNVSVPFTAVMCCGEAEQQRTELPSVTGNMTFATDPLCQAEVYRRPIQNGTASVQNLPGVSVNWHGRRGLWVCIDDEGAGFIDVLDPPTGVVPNRTYVNNPVVVTAAHHKLQGHELFVKIASHCRFEYGSVNATAEGLSDRAVYLPSQAERVAACVVIPSLRVVHHIGAIDAAPFLLLTDGNGHDVDIKAEEVTVLPVPPLSGRMWNITVQDAPCGDVPEAYVFGPAVTDAAVNFILRNTSYFTHVHVCFTNVYDGALAGVAAAPYGFRRGVAYDWIFWSAPRHFRAGDLTPLMLGNRRPGAKAFVKQYAGNAPDRRGGAVLAEPTCNLTEGDVALYRGDSMDGNLTYFSNTSTDRVLYMNLHPGSWVLCVEVVPGAGVYVTAGEFEVDEIIVSYPERPTACRPMQFVVDGLGINASAVDVDLRTGRPGGAECCSYLPELSPQGVNTLIHPATMARHEVDDVLTATFQFDSAVRQMLLLCARSATACYEIGLLPDGFDDAGCATPAPTPAVADPTDRRIGGAIDPLENDNAGGFAGLVVGLSIFLVCLLLSLCLFYLHAWRKKPKKKGPVSINKMSKISTKDSDSLKPGDTWMTHVEARERETLESMKKEPTPYILDRPVMSFSDISRQTPPRQGPGWYGADAGVQESRRATWSGADAAGSQHVHHSYRASYDASNSVSLQAPPPSSARGLMDDYRTANSSHGVSVFSASPRDGRATPLPRPPQHLQPYNLTAPDSASPYPAPQHLSNTAMPGQSPAPHSMAPHSMGDLYIVPPSTDRLSSRRPAPLGTLGSRRHPMASPLQSPTSVADPSGVAVSERSFYMSVTPAGGGAPHAASPRVLLYGGQSPRPVSPGARSARSGPPPEDADPLMLRRWEEAKAGAREDVETDEDRTRRMDVEREEENERFLVWEDFRKDEDALEMKAQQEKVDQKEQEEYEAQLRETEALKAREMEAERARVDQRREEQRRAEQQVLDMQEHLQEVERRRQAKEEAERHDAARSATKATDNALLQEVQRGRDERDQLERVRQQQAVEENLQIHRGKMSLQKEEAAPREGLELEEDQDFQALLSLHRQGLQTIHDLRARVQKSSEERLRAELQQREAVLAFEEEQRAALEKTEGEEHEQHLTAHRTEVAKREQVQALLKRQKELKEKQLKEEEEARNEMDAERRRIEKEKARIEEEKIRINATRMAQESREAQARSEALKRKAEQDQRLLEDNMLLAERASHARLTEERAREQIERERQKLMDERRAVENWRKKVEDDAQKNEAAATEARRRKKEQEALLEAERKRVQETWALQVGLTQKEANARREAELEAWKAWDALLANFQAGAAHAVHNQRYRESGERAKQRDQEAQEAQLKQLEADLQRSRRDRLKDSAASVMNVLAALAGQEDRR
eukprot:TRINITY_DN16612_c0_g1_i1.p1 TRINITY_DN16612_c0_g1~~TRINITY_DN16612_c0_g1_i1.p1  ORF type:complete len:2712 (+),score=847.85 TRINITY_DN16612_c0_g1_i1:77-8212(+)